MVSSQSVMSDNANAPTMDIDEQLHAVISTAGTTGKKTDMRNPASIFGTIFYNNTTVTEFVG